MCVCARVYVCVYNLIRKYYKIIYNVLYPMCVWKDLLYPRNNYFSRILILTTKEVSDMILEIYKQ